MHSLENYSSKGAEFRKKTCAGHTQHFRVEGYPPPVWTNLLLKKELRVWGPKLRQTKSAKQYLTASRDFQEILTGALWLLYEPLLLISYQNIQLNPKQFCSYLEKSFFSRNRYCLERGDANELSSGPDGSGNLLICHTHCLHRSSSTSLSWKTSKEGRKPVLGSIKCYRNLWLLLLSS